MGDDIRNKTVQYNNWTGTASADGHTNFELHETLGVDADWFIVYLDLVLYRQVQGVRAWGIKGTYADLEAQAKAGRVEVTRVADVNFQNRDPHAQSSNVESTTDFIARVFERLIVGLQWSQKTLERFEPYEMVEVDSLVDDR